MTRFRIPALAAVALGTGAALALAAPLAASAHVTVDPSTAEPGSYALIQVRVPNESDTAATIRVAVDLPADTPFASVRTVPVAGWTAELVRTELPTPVTIGESELTEAVTRVIWTADDAAGIGDGELQLFPLSVGPVPDVGSLNLPAEQTYSDGEVVAWNEEGDEAEHPAPVLYVNDAPAADHHGGGGDGGEGGHADGAGDDEHADAAAGSTDPSSAPQPDVLARVLGVLGLVVGAVGLVVGITARRKPTA